MKFPAEDTKQAALVLIKRSNIGATKLPAKGTKQAALVLRKIPVKGEISCYVRVILYQVFLSKVGHHSKNLRCLTVTVCHV